MQNVSIVILNWEGLELLKKCIPSVIKAAQNYPENCEIIVVDNGSKDKSIDYLKTTFPKIRIISLPENLGFSKGMNRGIRGSKNRIVISLNNDTIVKEDFIEPLVSHFADKDVFAVGAKMLGWDRKTFDFGRTTGRFPFGFFKIKYEDIDETAHTLYASGGALAVDKEKFLELGEFDENLFYWEDVDLGYRAWKRGWKNIFEPRSIVYHKKQGSMKKRYSKNEILTLARESHFLFTWKNLQDRRLLLLHILFLPALILVAVFSGKLYFIQGLFRALGKLRLARKKRREEKGKILLSDREVLRLSKKANKRNILEINVTSALGGGPEYMYSLVKGLDRSKYHIVAACPVDGPYFQRLRDLGIETIDLPIRSLHLGVLLRLVRIVRKFKIDLIHSHGKGAGIYSRPLGVITRTPVIHTLHGIHYGAYNPLMRKFYFLIERFLTSLTYKIVNLSESEEKEGLRLGIINKEKSRVIYSGIDLNRFDKVKINLARKRKELGLTGRNIVVGNVARFNLQKGHEYLIKAIPFVLRKYPRTKLLLVGDGELRGEMESLVGELEIKDNVIFTGFREDIPKILRIMDIFVLPSLWEGLPIVLLEAMACEKPIVATNVIGNKEVIIDGETGFLISPKDPRKLAEKIIFLIENKPLRERLGENGRRRVEKTYPLDRMVKETEEVYHEAL